MAKQIKFESIIEQLQRELGESYQTTFTSDRAKFNLPSKQKPLTDLQQSAYSNPVGGLVKGFRIQPKDAKEFSDSNAQLGLKPSSTIQSAAYWTDREYLVVSFKSGHTYSYNKVPLETIMAWEQASSAGSYFYFNIRMNYSYQKMG